MRHDLSRMKTTCPARSSKKNGNGRQDSTVNGNERRDSIVNGSDRTRSSSTVHRDSKSSRRNSKQKSKSSTKYLLQERISSGEEVSSM